MDSIPRTEDCARRTMSRRGFRAVALILTLGGTPWGCSSGGARPDGGGRDAAVGLDARSPAADAQSGGVDQGDADLAAADLAAARSDLAAPGDLGRPGDLLPAADLASAPDLAPSPDLAFPTAAGVDIYVDNFCKMDVIPKVFNVPRGVSLKLTYYNRSRDYPVTIWLSYGGGYTDLRTGGSWAEPIEHCRLPRPYSEYADISTACSSYRLMLNCL